MSLEAEAYTMFDGRVRNKYVAKVKRTYTVFVLFITVTNTVYETTFPAPSGELNWDIAPGGNRKFLIMLEVKFRNFISIVY